MLPSKNLLLHPVHLAIPRPSPHRLPLPPEQAPKQTPQQYQTRIRHNRRDESINNH